MNSPNILLIVLDAVRPDHCSCYGYDRETTPNIDQLAEDGTRYTNAFSNSNWTAEAHAGLFTGQVSSVSGCYGKHLKLPNSVPVLPELLQEAGYETFGVSAGAHLRRNRGYDRGFSEYLSTTEFGRRYTKIPMIPKLVGPKRAALEGYFLWLIRGGDNWTHFKARALSQRLKESNRPFFGFVNFKTAHAPYESPEPYNSYFMTDSIYPESPVLYLVYRRFLEKHPDTIDGIPYERIRQITEGYPLLTNDFEPSEEEWEVIRSLYDGAIRYMDNKIGLILRSLRQSGKLDDTWIIITADHGEFFGERGLESHVFSLYEQLLRVPLIIRSPNKAVGKVTDMCSLIDLYPTICEIAGIDSPTRRHAKSLLQLGSDPDHKYIFAEVGRKENPKIKDNHPDFESIRQTGPLQSVRDDTWKLIRFGPSDVELYKWVDDPGERNECSTQHPEVVERLREVLSSELKTMDKTSHNETDEILSPDVEQQLEYLGYR